MVDYLPCAICSFEYERCFQNEDLECYGSSGEINDNAYGGGVYIHCGYGSRRDQSVYKFIRPGHFDDVLTIKQVQELGFLNYDSIKEMNMICDTCIDDLIVRNYVVACFADNHFYVEYPVVTACCQKVLINENDGGADISVNSDLYPYRLQPVSQEELDELILIDHTTDCDLIRKSRDNPSFDPCSIPDIEKIRAYYIPESKKSEISWLREYNRLCQECLKKYIDQGILVELKLKNIN